MSNDFATYVHRLFVTLSKNSLQPHGLCSLRNSPDQNAGVGSLSLLQGASQPRNQTGVACIAGGFFTNRAIREAPESSLNSLL